MAISDIDFNFIRDLVGKHSALMLDEGKQYLVESRLQPVATRSKLDSIANLVGALRMGNTSLREQVVEAMTTNETSFFRDLHPFQALQKEVLPQLIKARNSVRQLNFWCAACSSGQEPYSLSMMLTQHFPQLANWNIRILCTDISKEMLERCRKGCFSQIEVNRGLPAPMMIKYFKQDGAHWQINEKLKKPLEFRQLNLAEPFPAIGIMDIVFLRNVLIYFNPKTKQDILKKMKRVLKPDGNLILGSTETTLTLDTPFERVAFGRAAFYKIEDA